MTTCAQNHSRVRGVFLKVTEVHFIRYSSLTFFKSTYSQNMICPKRPTFLQQAKKGQNKYLQILAPWILVQFRILLASVMISGTRAFYAWGLTADLTLTHGLFYFQTDNKVLELNCSSDAVSTQLPCLTSERRCVRHRGLGHLLSLRTANPASRFSQNSD